MPLHIDVLLGVSLGVLIGTVPAILVGLLRFGLEYASDYRPPRAMAVVIALVVAGGSSYLIEVFPSPSEIAVLQIGIVSVVVSTLALYADSQGAAYATRFPHRISEASRSNRTLSEEALDDIDGSGEVLLTAYETVGNITGHPPLEPELRAALEEDSWRMPADLPLSELESRLENRLQTEYDLGAVSVSVDDRARISIQAAPKSTDIAEQIPEEKRAVSVDTLLPTGLDRGDRVTISLDETAVNGTVLSAQATPEPSPAQTVSQVGETVAVETNRSGRDQGAAGGHGRVTVSVPEEVAKDVLDADDPQITVTPKEGNPAFEAFSHLRQVGKEIRNVILTDRTRELIRETAEECRIICIRSSGTKSADPCGWKFHPTKADIENGREAFVVVSRDSEIRELLSTEGVAIERGEKP